MLETGPHIPVIQLAAEARTVGEMFRQRVEKSRNAPAFYHKCHGQWKKTTWGGFEDQARRAARGLVDGLGLEPGERIAILGPTQPAWAIYDVAAQLVGVCCFGIYPRMSVEQVRYLLEHSEARAVFVEGASELRTVLEAARESEALKAIVPWSEELYRAYEGQDERLVSPTLFEGEPLDEERLNELLAAIDPQAVALLVYTSGTTGPPKAAMLSHRNILSLLGTSSEEFVTIYESDISLSFLPMAHAAERIMVFYGRISAGFATAYATGFANVLAEIQEVQPTIFGAVPRIFEKAYARIQSELEKKPALIRRLFEWAVRLGKARTRERIEGKPMSFSERCQLKLADPLVFRKVREAFGGRVRYFMTGAAPISLEILEFFWGADLPIYEAYGMTEATCVTHANRPGSVRLGSVGRPVPPMQHRIADDGEILLKGPWLFEGYLKDPEATKRALDGGWLHTGDIGRIDEDGFLYITDRKKHLIITAGGKNLTPANIERAVKHQDPLISQVHAHGDKRPYVTAIIAPSPIETLEWGRERGLVSAEEVAARTEELLKDPTSRSEALNQAVARVVVHPGYRERIRRAVAKGNEHLARVEQVKRFHILDRDFSQAHGELTPTMKMKRKVIEESYRSLFDRTYDEEDFALEP